MGYFISRLSDVGSGGSFGPGRMRVVEAYQVQIVGFYPHKSIVLLLWIHPEFYRTLGCIGYPDHRLDETVPPGQQPTSLQRSLLCNVTLHLLPVHGRYFQLSYHLSNKHSEPPGQAQRNEWLNHRASLGDAFLQVVRECGKRIKWPKQHQTKLDG